MRWLLSLEVASVLAFVAAGAWALLDRPDVARPLAAEGDIAGPPVETWYGLFVDGQHVGWVVSRESPLQDGGRLFGWEVSTKVNSMGVVTDLVLSGQAVADAMGQLQRFEGALTSPLTLTAKGEVRPGVLHVDLDQGGEVSPMDFPVSAPPQISETVDHALARRVLTTGDHFELPYYNMVTSSFSTMKVDVEGPAELPDGGGTGWWVRTDVDGATARRLVDGNGAMLREDSAMGFSQVRMTEQEARNVDAAEPPDLVARAAVPVRGEVHRGTRSLSLAPEGVPPATIPDEPGWQHHEGDVVRVIVPDVDLLPPMPVRGDHDIDPTPFLPAADPELVAKAREVVADAPDRLTAARRLNDFVHGYVHKVPTLGVPNGLTVLHTAEGDCNEHTALFVSLARAAGIPSRIAAGLVWSDLLGDAFYYHAWPEVELGDGSQGIRWVPVDPTFGQFPADATHLKLVTGDLDKQVEITRVMGKLSLRVAD